MIHCQPASSTFVDEEFIVITILRIASYPGARPLIVLLLSGLSVPALAQQPDAEKTKKLHEELNKAAEERMNQARQNLQAYFEARKVAVRWGNVSRQTRITGNGVAFGRATFRFDFVWANSGDKGYFKSGTAEFELVGQNWRLQEIIWRTPVPDNLEVLMPSPAREIDILKVLSAEKGLGFWMKEGRAKAKAKEWESAVAAFKKAIDLEPLAVFPWNERGIANLRLGQARRAVTDFTKAIELAPTNPVLWNNRANALGELGQWQAAIADDSKAIELKGDFEFAWLHRGSARASTGQWDKAAEDYAKAATFPKTAHGASAYGALVQLQLKNPKGYRQACQRLVDTWAKGEDAKEAVLVAWTCSVAPDSGTELGHLIAVLEKSGAKDYTSLRALGSALYRSGKSQQAAEALTKAIESRKQPSPAAWIFLAMAHQQMGEKAEARNWLEKAGQRVAELRKEAALVKPQDGLALKTPPWNEILTLELSLREAEHLLKSSGK
jgi:tetratricopeptide (TPR) repeat protein